MPFKDKTKQVEANKRYRKKNVFTLNQIKKAFWSQFHKSGERWFNYLGTDEENIGATDSVWQQFLDDLKEAKE